MDGVALLLSALCFNGTNCPNQHMTPAVNYYEYLPRDLYKSSKALSVEMTKLAAEIKGQTLNVTTLEDYPLSYVIRENGTLVGKGWAFEFFDYLVKKYDFKYNIVIPDINIVGGSNDSEGSLMQMMIKKVRKKWKKMWNPMVGLILNNLTIKKN